MVVLCISKLNNEQYAGININIPKYVKELNNYCPTAYLDLGKINLDNLSDYKYYFKKGERKFVSLNDLPEPFNKPDIVVFQTLYIKEFVFFYKYLKKEKIPYTIIPRCSMTASAQKKKKIKKVIGNLIFYNKFIRNAEFIHFLTENEKKESSNFKFKNSVVIGNGIEEKKEKYKIKNRKSFKVVYIGRLDIYHKGLDILIDAIYKEKRFFYEHNISFYLYGPDFEKNLSLLTKKIKELDLENLILICPAVYNEEKKRILLDSDIFIQTSRLEGQPTGVIEAISYGIPVIVTPGTNLSDDVKKFNLGYIADLNDVSISSAIVKSFNEKKSFDKISKNAIKYAENNFDWNKISKEIMAKYSKYIGK